MTGGNTRPRVGAELLDATTTRFRVWAPAHQSVEVLVDGRATTMHAEPGGYFSAEVKAAEGARYGFRLPGDTRLYPDPASRWQPQGPLEPSAVIDTSRFPWTDGGWRGIELPGQVLYEMHIGTYTREGTWRAAAAHLERLRDLGVTVVQMMPVAAWGGSFGWGYDGVQWYAPTHTYGTPADLQAFVNRAHEIGLAVILDVVYNHMGPSGNFLSQFSPRYFTSRHANEWGEALNYDDDAGPVRDLVLGNVDYWIREFHFDGLRLDAAQQIADDSPEHLLTAIARTARAAAHPRSVIVIAEHERQDPTLLRPVEAGGYGIDGVFHEDFHHSVRVALTGVREAYLSDYTGSSREWLAAAQWGFLFQGQYYPWQSMQRGATALDIPAFQFVNFLENHDQVANAVAGRRLVDLTHPGWWRAMSALLLLGPWTPLLFQGQEWGAREPFTYFTDHDDDLQAAVARGRAEFLRQFKRAASVLEAGNSTASHAALKAATLSHEHGPQADGLWQMYRDLLALRRNDPSLGQHAVRLAGSTLGDRTLALRFIGAQSVDDRLLIVNLDPDMNIASVADPLLAAPPGMAWSILWCSEDPRYGGNGIVPPEPPVCVTAAGHAATVFAPRDAAP